MHKVAYAAHIRGYTIYGINRLSGFGFQFLHVADGVGDGIGSIRADHRIAYDARQALVGRQLLPADISHSTADSRGLYCLAGTCQGALRVNDGISGTCHSPATSS